jgi:hypothetical protein
MTSVADLVIFSTWYLYTLIRRPRMILDFTLTLLFLHIVFTTYYSASVPTSLFFWLVMIAGSVFMIVVAEQLCVKREMNEGLAVPSAARIEEGHDIEMNGLLDESRRD